MGLPDWVPVRDELRELEPYGAPQIRDLVNLNVNENPYAPGSSVVADIAEAARAAASTLNRYPDREARELRKHSRTTSATVSRPTGCGRPTGRTR